jgi:hypothetical protein
MLINNHCTTMLRKSKGNDILAGLQTIKRHFRNLMKLL